MQYQHSDQYGDKHDDKDDDKDDEKNDEKDDEKAKKGKLTPRGSVGTGVTIAKEHSNPAATRGSVDRAVKRRKAAKEQKEENKRTIPAKANMYFHSGVLPPDIIRNNREEARNQGLPPRKHDDGPVQLSDSESPEARYRFTCKYCGHKFSSQFHFNRHQMVTHGDVGSDLWLNKFYKEKEDEDAERYQ